MARLLGFVALLALLAGCLNPTGPGAAGDDGLPDEPMRQVADFYYNVTPAMTYMERFAVGQVSGQQWRFHTFEEVVAKVERWEADHPDLVEVRTLGTSHEGRPVLGIVVTDEAVPSAGKLAPLLDGAHHGNEYEAGELMLYTVDTLLENHARNATVRSMLRELEVHVVPVVNPDGWVAGGRFNGNAVNLNRNYDVDWGNPGGTSNPLVGLASETGGLGLGGVGIVAENCGAAPFSEPESQAMRDLMASLGDRAAFYLTGHTPSHGVIGPWAAFEPPFPMPAEHEDVIDAELEWIAQNTEYETGRAGWGDFSAGVFYAVSGSSMDYFYAEHQKPAFTLEAAYFPTSLAHEDPERDMTPYDGLRYWMDATLPIPMHMLANARELSRWQTPAHDALVPELSAEQHPPLPEGWKPPLEPHFH